MMFQTELVSREEQAGAAALHGPPRCWMSCSHWGCHGSSLLTGLCQRFSDPEHVPMFGPRHSRPGSTSGFHWFDFMEIFTTAVYAVVAKERVASWTFFSSECWSHMGNTFVRWAGVFGILLLSGRVECRIRCTIKFFFFFWSCSRCSLIR